MRPRGSRGFALLIVLWMLVLIGFLVARVTADGRIELLIARNIYATAAAEAAVDGAINEAIFWLSDPQPSRAWRPDGAIHELTIGKSRIVLRVDNEAARINPNYAPPALLEALLRATGCNAEVAKRLGTAIAVSVGMPIAGRSREDAAADYQALGFDNVPPRQPIETLDELAWVPGMTPALLAALRPHLTIYGPRIPDPGAADPIVAAALTDISGQPQGSRRAMEVAARRGGFMTARITGTAYGPENAEVTRIAVVRLNPAIPGRAVKLAWGASVD